LVFSRTRSDHGRRTVPATVQARLDEPLKAGLPGSSPKSIDGNDDPNPLNAAVAQAGGRL
jgi:hypothetical protein